MSRESIASPVPTGWWIEVAFMTGYRYVALPDHCDQNVGLLYRLKVIHNEVFQVTPVRYYKSRPEMLIYYEHIFHVADIKVTLFFFTLTLNLIL